MTRKPWHYIVSGYYRGEAVWMSKQDNKKRACHLSSKFVVKAERMNEPSSKVTLVIPFLKKRFTIREVRMI